MYTVRCDKWPIVYIVFGYTYNYSYLFVCCFADITCKCLKEDFNIFCDKTVHITRRAVMMSIKHDDGYNQYKKIFIFVYYITYQNFMLYFFVILLGY